MFPSVQSSKQRARSLMDCIVRRAYSLMIKKREFSKRYYV